jgi:hypothetical protein
MGGFFLISGGLSPGGGVSRFVPWPVTAALFLPLAGLTAWYLVRHAGRTQNDLVKISFVLGLTLIFIPLDIALELGGDLGVLIFTALIIGILLRLRQQANASGKGLVQQDLAGDDAHDPVHVDGAKAPVALGNLAEARRSEPLRSE